MSTVRRRAPCYGTATPTVHGTTPCRITVPRTVWRGGRFSRYFAVVVLGRGYLDMDRERIILLLLLRRRMKKKQKQRKFWINPYIFTMNQDGGHFKRKYEALKLCGNEKFFEYFRMTITSFEELFTKIGPRLQKQYVFRKPVDPIERLGLTIR